MYLSYPHLDIFEKHKKKDCLIYGLDPETGVPTNPSSENLRHLTQSKSGVCDQQNLAFYIQIVQAEMQNKGAPILHRGDKIFLMTCFGPEGGHKFVQIKDAQGKYWLADATNIQYDGKQFPKGS